MNSIQLKRIEEIKELIVRMRSHSSPDTHEFKQTEVNEYEPFVSLVVEYGMKNDEGTMASLVARDRWHIAITPKGGVRLMSVACGLKSKSFAYTTGPRGVYNAVMSGPWTKAK